MKRLFMGLRSVLSVAVSLAVFSASAELSTKLYVQNGLVAHWDGINNVGTGIHDASATSWKDLTGKCASWSLVSDKAWFSAAALEIQGSEYHSAYLPGSLPSYKSLEICLRWDSGQQVLSNTDYKRIFILNWGDYTICCHRNASGATTYPVDTRVVKGSTNSYCCVYDANGTSPVAYYVNGSIMSGGTKSITYGWITGTYPALGSRYSVTDCIFMGGIQTIRLYSRCLSASEAAYNACIDSIRFKNADPTSLTWPDGYRWNAEKNLPEFAVTVTYGSGVTAVTADGEPVADGGQVWLAWSEGKSTLQATLASGYETAQWLGKDVTVVASVNDKQAVLSAAMSPTTLSVSGVSKSTLGDLPINGLVQHYDAADLSTIITNTEGNVLQWRSKARNPLTPDVVPALGGWCYTNSLNESCFPFYSATEMNNRGGIVMGKSLAAYKEGNTYCLLSGMTGTVASANRTVFFVVHTLPKLNGINRGVYFGGVDGPLANTTSNSQGIRNDADYAGGGWLWQDGYCFAQPGSSGNLTVIFKGTGNTQVGAIECTESVMKSYPTFRPAIAKAYATNMGHVHGVYGEVAIYDRVLTQGDITYINAHLRNKWMDTSIARKRTQWIGGATGDWNVAANWDNGLPDNARAAVISNATVNVPAGDYTMWDLDLKDVTLNLAPNAYLHVEEVTAMFGATAVNVGQGAQFSTDDYCEPWGAGPVVALDGGRFVYRPRPTSVARSWFWACNPNQDACGNPTQLQLTRDTLASTHRSLLPKVTGTGEFCCAGAGVTDLDTQHLPAAGLEFAVAGGALDLNGCDLTVKSLKGTAILRNSSTQTATVTVENSTAAEVSPHLEGAIKLIAKGGAAFSHLGGGTAAGGIEVDGSTLKAATDVIERKYGNPVIHLDASRPETMVTNSLGEIVRWNSTDAHGQSFMLHPVTAVNGTYYTNSLPVWSATAFNGKPTALFSVNAAGTGSAMTKKPALIRSVSSTTNLTFFIVGRLFGGAWVDWGAHYTAFVGAACIGTTALYTPCVGSGRNWNFGSSFPYALENGKVLYDSVNGPTTAIAYDALQNHDFVLAYRAGDAVSGVYPATIAGFDGSYGGARVASGKFSEVLVYDRRLSNEEMKEISAVLMKKWGVTPSTEAETVPVPGTLNATSTITLRDGATLDLGGVTNAVAKIQTSGGDSAITNGIVVPAELEVVVNDTRHFPKVTGDADWVLGAMTLSFDGQPGFGNIVKTTGTIDGEPAAVLPTKYAARVRTDAHRLALPAGTIIIFK